MSEVGTLTKCTGIHMYLSSISINIPQTIVLFHLYASINTVNARNIYIYIYISVKSKLIIVALSINLLE